MTSTERIFHKDYANLTAALEPFVTVHPQGFCLPSPGTPAQLLSSYRAMTSLGYAKGWL